MDQPEQTVNSTLTRHADKATPLTHEYQDAPVVGLGAPDDQSDGSILTSKHMVIENLLSLRVESKDSDTSPAIAALINRHNALQESFSTASFVGNCDFLLGRDKGIPDFKLYLDRDASELYCTDISDSNRVHFQQGLVWTASDLMSVSRSYFFYMLSTFEPSAFKEIALRCEISVAIPDIDSHLFENTSVVRVCTRVSAKNGISLYFDVQSGLLTAVELPQRLTYHFRNTEAVLAKPWVFSLSHERFHLTDDENITVDLPTYILVQFDRKDGSSQYIRLKVDPNTVMLRK